MPVCLSSLLPHLHLLPFHCHLCIYLWTPSGCHSTQLCLLCFLGIRLWLSSFSFFALSCPGFLVHFPNFMMPALWVTSVFISGPWFPTRPMFSPPSLYLCFRLSIRHPFLRLDSCSSWSLLACPSSSVPSSPLLPSPSAVSPTGSASCCRCSCTAAWGQWPGAMSPQ